MGDYSNFLHASVRLMAIALYQTIDDTMSFIFGLQ